MTTSGLFMVPKTALLLKVLGVRDGQRIEKFLIGKVRLIRNNQGYDLP